MAIIPKQRSAFWALAAAGGLWAWQNRDKLQGYLKQSGILDQVNSALQNAGTTATPTTTTSHQHPTTIVDSTATVQPMTGETRRMNEAEFTNETTTKYDPSI